METDNPESMGIGSPHQERNRRTQRINNACLRCRQRKARCNGAVPNCGNCQHQNKPCQYIERKARGPGRSKQRIRGLEERLRDIESLLQKKPTVDLDSRTAPREPHQHEPRCDENSGVGKITPGSTISTDDEPSNRDSSAGGFPDMMECIDRSGLSPISENGSALPAPLATIASMLPSQTAIQYLRPQEDQAGKFLTQTIFAPVPPREYTIPLLENALEGDMGRFWPLLCDSKPALLEMVGEQYHVVAEDGSHQQHPARWATVNVLLAMAIQWKAVSTGVELLFPISWTYFKNAFSVFSQLVLLSSSGDHGVGACRAVLFMAMFMQGTADTRATSALVATASHLAQVAGLHLRNLYPMHVSSEAEEDLRRVFWTIHIISCNDAAMGGLPPSFNVDYVDVDLPSERSTSDGANSNILRYMAQLSVIQSRVLAELYRAKVASTTLSPETIVNVTLQLQNWVSGLPPSIRPRSDHDVLPDHPARVYRANDDPDPSVLQLHLSYHAILCKLAFAMPRRYDTTTGVPICRNPWDHPKYAARHSMLLVLQYQRQIPSPPHPLLWQILGYAAAAFIVLAAEVLHKPSEVVEGDLDLLRSFLSHLGDLKSRGGYDLQALSVGLVRLYDLVANAVHEVDAASAQPRHQSLLFGYDRMRDIDSDDKCTHVRECLSEVGGDLMNIVSSGLMGNMPIPYAAAARIFVDIFEIPAPATATGQHGFGPFVPVVLQPLTYGFAFESR
ncbi:hypothetical protein V8F06_007368 [Rhypophila decipiens]